MEAEPKDPEMSGVESEAPSLDLRKAPAFTLRKAVEEDLPHMAVLSGAAGGKIVPGGGDFVLQAWPNWWKQDPRLHFNTFCFDGERPAGFVRVECYGKPQSPDSGWLEGLRVDPLSQGLGVMTKVIDACTTTLPSTVRSAIYLAVGSTNEKMVAISNKKYEFLGGMIMQGFNPQAETAGATNAVAASMHVRPLAEADLGAAWALLSSQPAHKAGQLLLPGRFYGFRAANFGALAEKIECGKAVGVFGSGDATPLLALVLAFDSGMEREENGQKVVIEIHTIVVSTRLEAATVGGVLLAFGRSRPTAAPSGANLRTLLSTGPFLPATADDPGSVDVDERLKQALALAGYSRPMASHLRVYRMPQPEGASSAPVESSRLMTIAVTSVAVGLLAVAAALASRRGR